MVKVSSQTKTYRFRINSTNLKDFETTQKLFNEVIFFYYDLLINKENILELSNQNALRELERLTISTSEISFPFSKVPALFRRAAINCALAHSRSYFSNLQNYKASKSIKKMPVPATSFHVSTIFYKGFYKYHGNGLIDLKLWNGSKWVWQAFHFSLRREIKEEEMLSPSVVLHKEYAMLHVPIKGIVEDTRTLKERIECDSLCGVSFTNGDSFAVCATMNAKGEVLGSTFIKGGNEYVHHCNEILKKIAKSNESLQLTKTNEAVNKKYYQHLYQLGEYYAHLVSKRIVEFCVEQNCTIIVLPNFDEAYTTLLAKNHGRYTSMYLSGRIVRYVKYKAWEKGILVTGVRPTNTATTCSICGEKIKVNKKTKEFTCVNGHKGNKDLNGARNMILQCFIKMGKRVR